MIDEKTAYRQQSSSPIPGGKFFFLFLFLLLQLILYPYTQDNGWFQLITLLVTIFSIYAVIFRRLTWIVALLIAIPVAVHRTVLFERTATRLELAGLALSLAFDVFVVVVIFERVFHTREVNSGTIFGALSIYLMVGFAFTRLYLFLVALQPSAFYLDPVLNRHRVADHADLVFYSFGTMTSLGSAGISPLTAQAKSLSIVEAILGILYLGVLVSRLIGMYHRSPGSNPRNAAAE